MPSTDPAYEELLDFFHKGRKKTYQKGEVILRAGDIPQGIYLIEKGNIKIYALSKEGDEHTHVFYQAGDIFPLIWAFKEAIRNVYYQALEDVVVWVVPKEEFLAFVNENVHVAVKLLGQAVEMFRLYAGRIDNLLYSNSYERTAYRLLSLKDRFGEKHSDGWIINSPHTHQDIASTVNLTRETVSRAMERMQRRGIIAYDTKRRIVIKDVAGLMHVIGEDEAIGMWPELETYT